MEVTAQVLRQERRENYEAQINRRLEAEHRLGRNFGIVLLFTFFILIFVTAYMFLKADKWAGMVFALLAFGTAVLGCGLAVPGARPFILRLFDMFREAVTGLIPRRADRSDQDAPLPASPEDAATGNFGAGNTEEETELEPVAEIDPPPEPKPEEEKLLGEGEAPTEVHERWDLTAVARQPIRDRIGPTYLLDDTYHFLDWNPVFDRFVAKPLGIKRGDHAEKFVNNLVNQKEVVERTQQTFKMGSAPLVDIEALVFETEDFGVIEFQKIASKVIDPSGENVVWVVNLNVSDIEEDKAEAFWAETKKILEDTANWSGYAISYDRLLLNFPDYNDLVEMVVSKVGDAKRCIDIGAATGNTTCALLRQPDRHVWAVESNETMLDYLAQKVGRLEKRDQANYWDRLVIVKGNALHLDEFDADFFDAATMTNVLYAVDDPVQCLHEIYRVLKPSGILSMSTSSDETDIDKLFDAIKKSLEGVGKFEELQADWFASREAHYRMEEKIHRDTKQDIRKYLEQSGFDVVDWHGKVYADAVVVVKASAR